MKKAYILVFALLISVSGMGHPTLRKHTGEGSSPSKSIFKQIKQHSRLSSAQQMKLMQQKIAKSALSVKQRLDSMVYSAYDASSSQYVFSDKETYVYSVEGNNVLETDYEFDQGINQWVPYFKGEFSYDAGIRMISVIMYDWDDSSGQWLLSDKEDLAYDNNGNNDSTIQSIWNDLSSSWEAINLQVNTYNASGKLELTNYFFWDLANGGWVLSSKDEYTYNTNGNITSLIQQNLDPFNAQWIFSYKMVYEYEIVWGRLVTTISSYYDAFNHVWVDSYKEEYTYNSDGSIVDMISSDWDTFASAWLLSYKSDFNYNSLYSFTDLILPYYLATDVGMYFSKMITSVMGYYYDGGNWETEGNSGLYYAPHITSGILEGPSISARVFPNPAGSTITVETGESAIESVFILTDLCGRTVMESRIQGTTQLSLGSMPAGLYFYTLTGASGKSFSGKLMLE